jgi:hypothetical protein
MTVRFGALILSALALGAMAAPSFADPVKLKPKHHVARVESRSQWKGVSEDFFPGQLPDPGSDNRYFSDTRSPNFLNLGAPIFQRWEE